MKCKGRHCVQLFTAARAADYTPALSIAELATIIERDFVDGQYYVTGRLTESAFDAQCVFKDPTVTVTGVRKYADAVAQLFDGDSSRADLISLRVLDDHNILLTWRLEGALRLGGLRIKPYTGSTLYTTNAAGRVVRHTETWDISPLDAFVSCFLPSFGAPPAPPIDEIIAARRGAV